MTDRTKQLLDYDPLQAAENITGESYRNEDTGMLGLLLAMDHSARKEAHLIELGDSTLCNKLERYRAIIEDIGFELVLDIPFMGRGWGEQPVEEHFFVFVHRELGILLDFDTFGGDGVNGGKFYYCIKLNENACGRVTSSGTFRDYDSPNRYWAGDHDCREAIRYHIDQLKANGTFLKNWPKDNDLFLWMLHYMDTKDDNYNYKAINKERQAMLPIDVQEQFGFR